MGGGERNSGLKCPCAEALNSTGFQTFVGAPREVRSPPIRDIRGKHQAIDSDDWENVREKIARTDYERATQRQFSLPPTPAGASARGRAAALARKSRRIASWSNARLAFSG
jgi:hypothetical protein